MPRITYEYDEAARARILVMKAKIGAPDTAEVVLQALRLLEWAVDEVGHGRRVVSIDANGRGEEVTPAWADAARDYFARG